VKIAAQGWIESDLSDVDHRRARWCAELGFHGTTVHIDRPAEDVPVDVARRAAESLSSAGLDLLQLWGPYPCIISSDNAIRRAGVRGAQEIARLAARMGVPASGVRPTSLNPRWEWAPHPDNYLPETEDRLVDSLREIVKVSEDEGLDLVLESHIATTLTAPGVTRRVVERVGSPRLKVNIDPVNFVGDLRTAFEPAPIIHELFDALGTYVATVHVKDFYLEDRFVVHVSETVPGAGLMDIDTVIERAYSNQPDGWLVIEHLPVSQIPQAMQNLTAHLRALSVPVGR
jgi:sugar phosphate isomerase/epimerase